jgi:hypothetical protein
MNTTVDLEINEATGEHKIILVKDGERWPLGVSEAAKLQADVASVVAFSLEGAPAIRLVSGESIIRSPYPERMKLKSVTPEPEEEEPTEDLDEDTENDVDEDFDAPPRLKWHRVGTGMSTYQTVLPSGKKVQTKKSANGQGWDVYRDKKKVNTAPIGSKRAAALWVEQELRKKDLEKASL